MKILRIVAVDVVMGVPKIFRAPICRAHCAVIFAIAQLSCSFKVLAALITVALAECEFELSVPALESWRPSGGLCLRARTLPRGLREAPSPRGLTEGPPCGLTVVFGPPNTTVRPRV